MVDAVTLQTITVMIAGASVMISAVFAVLQLRNVARTRKTGLIIQLNPSLRVSQREMHEAHSRIMNLQYKDYNDFVKKYGPLVSEGEAQMAIGIMWSYFEGMGFLLQRKLLEIDVVEFVTGGWGGIKPLWEKLKPILGGIKEEYNIEMTPFEHLVNEIQKREHPQA